MQSSPTALLLAAIAALMLLAVAVPPSAHAVTPAFEEVFPSLTIPSSYGYMLVYLQTPGPAAARHLAAFQSGLVRFWDDASTTTSAALNITTLVVSGGEQGLLGMALDANWVTNGYVYLSYTTASNRLGLSGGDSVVSRWTMDTTTLAIDEGSEFVLLRQPQPYSNHNGGMLLVEPTTGYLTVFFGDGGSAGDPENRAQNTSTWLGKILRIDVTATAAATNYTVPASNPFVGMSSYLPEIFALGVRNPWRGSYDPLAPHWLWVGDVGQNNFEEVDIIQSGRNYGWRVIEGFQCFEDPDGCERKDPMYTPPILAYAHSDTKTGGISITGGGVYRDASRNPDLNGTYIYADFSGRIFAARFDGSDPDELQNVRIAVVQDGAGLPVSFGYSRSGDLYYMDGSTLKRFVANSVIPPNDFKLADRDLDNAAAGIRTVLSLLVAVLGAALLV